MFKTQRAGDYMPRTTTVSSYRNNLLCIDSPLGPMATSNSAVRVPDTPDIVHRRFAHRIRPKGMDTCTDCVNAKATRASIDKGVGCVDVICELIDSDLSGKMPVRSREGHGYWATFIDNHSRYVKMFCLKTKDQALQAFKDFVK